MGFSSVPVEQRARLRPLYDGFPGLRGVIDAALEGVVGEVWADDVAAPRVARIGLDDFHCIAGDFGAAVAVEAVAAVPSGHYVATPESWQGLVMTRGGVWANDRFAFRAPEVWDSGWLAAMRAGLAPGFVLHRITAETIAGFERLERSLTANFGAHERFLSRGVGFGITNEAGEFVAGCASYAISSRRLEFEIQTRADYQRRGLALVTGSAMIEYCIAGGLEACWDAAHEGSAVLAERLGFVGRRRYTAYRVG